VRKKADRAGEFGEKERERERERGHSRRGDLSWRN